jgi:hypothetical protein
MQEPILGGYEQMIAISGKQGKLRLILQLRFKSHQPFNRLLANREVLDSKFQEEPRPISIFLTEIPHQLAI